MYPGQLEAWITTLVVEGLVAALLALPARLRPGRAALAAVAGSLLSHPIVWWLFYELRPHLTYWPIFAIVEALAVAIETPFYRAAGARWGLALALSFLVNAASVLVGLSPWLWRQWGW